MYKIGICSEKIMHQKTIWMLCKRILNIPMDVLEFLFFSSAEEIYAYQGEAMHLLILDMNFQQMLYQRMSLQNRKNEKMLVFKHGCPDGEIPMSAIRYVRSESNYVRIYLEQKTMLYARTMKSVQQMTKDSDMIRIHKSVMVNLAYVDGIRNNHVVLYDQTILPIGRTYRERTRQSVYAYKNMRE